MATVEKIQAKLKYIDPSYKLTAMLFQTAEIKAIVLLPDHKLAVFTDLIQGVADQLGPWQGIKVDENGTEIDGRNYKIISLED